jgi:hypothetical protein
MDKPYSLAERTVKGKTPADNAPDTLVIFPQWF